MPSYSSDGDVLHYDEHGAGTPVAVVGGGPARHPDYLGDLGGLSRRVTLAVLHLRGSDGSPLPDDPSLASWWSQAADLEALRRHLGLERMTVLGHSAGTSVALAFAARFPDSLERLILVVPPATGLVEVESDVPAIRSRRAGEPAWDAALTTAQQGPPTDGDDDRLNAWQQAIAPISYAAWGAAQQEHARIGRWNAAAIGAWGSVEPPATFRADLAQVQAPVRIIAAAEDGVVGRAAPLALAHRFADSGATTVEGAGHYPWIDRPAEFVAAAASALQA